MSSARVCRVTARAEHQGLRIDRVLCELAQAECEGVSRATVQRWLDAELVRSEDASVVRNKHKVLAGQVFVVEVPPDPASAALPEPDVELQLVHVDDDLLVVDKPAGLVVHPAHGHASGTLVNGLLGRGLFARELLEDAATEHDRPGIVHRIDKDTSGLLVVARTAMAREHLKAQFAEHSIDRVYQALVLGDLQSCTYSTLHGRHPKDRVKFSSRVREGKRAITHVTRITGFDRLATHVECRLETGRTHQIRVHLADHGHPLLGDPLYGERSKNDRVRRAAEALGRQALHAATLGFTHPRSGARLRFDSPLPADFLRALGLLGS